MIIQLGQDTVGARIQHVRPIDDGQLIGLTVIDEYRNVFRVTLLRDDVKRLTSALLATRFGLKRNPLPSLPGDGRNPLPSLPPDG